MRWKWLAVVAALALLVPILAGGGSLVGCSGGDDDTEAGDDDTQAGDDDTPAGTPAGDDDVPPPSWKIYSGPCVGYGTDRLWFDNQDYGFLGCGENTDGTGLYLTEDGGMTWSSVSGFERIRVSHMSRAKPNILLVAGKHVDNQEIAWAVDTSTSPWTITVLLEYSGSDPFMRISHGDNIVSNISGATIVDSLSGNYIAYQAGPEEDWVEAYYWNEGSLDGDNQGYQLLDIIPIGEHFYGVGSTISEPPTVFLPSTDPRATYQFLPLPLTSDSRNGELYGIAAADAEHFVVVGSNQDTHGGVIFRSTGDPYQLSNWEEVDLSRVVEDHGVLRDVHISGGDVLVVGERYPQDHGGLALLSHDGGMTWEDVTPPDAPLLWNCWVHLDGRMVVTSAEYTAVY